jgi:hypothetical protein
MAEIGNLTVRIGAQTDGLTQGLKDSESKLASFGKSAAKGVAGLAKLAAAAAAAGAALVTALAKQGLEAVDAQAKMARSLDATADGLRAMQIAADRAGVSQSALESAAQRLNSSLAQAARTGSGPAAEALNRLGLSAQELSRMDVDERMATLADRMAEMGLSAGQAQDTLQQLGIRSKEMALLMTQGGDAIRSARQDVNDFGLSLSEVDSRNVERANDAMRDVARLVDVVRQRLAAALAPILEMISKKFLDNARETGGFKDAIDRLIQGGVTGFSHLANAVEILRRAFITITSAATVFYGTLISGASDALAALIAGPVEGVNMIIRAMNNIPGINVDEFAPPELTSRLRELSDQAAGYVEDAKARIVEAFSEPLPGEGIRNAYAEAVRIANESSQAEIAAAESRNERLRELDDERPGGAGADTAEAERRAAEEQARLAALAEKEKEALAARLERLRVSMLDEMSLLEERHAANLLLLQQALDAELLTEQEHKERLRQLEDMHANAVEEIRARSAAKQQEIVEQSVQGQVRAMVSGIEQMTSAVDSGSKTMFRLNKAAALANALLSAREAITGAYAVGARLGGPKLGAVYAAAAGVAQMAQIRSIRSQSMSGGGMALGGAPSGSTTIEQRAPTTQAAPTQLLQVSGISPSDLFTGQAVRELAGKLLDFQKDGGKVVFAN